MKEIPILFSGPMVRAILDGTKTQTRRIVKPQPGVRCTKYAGVFDGAGIGFYEGWHRFESLSQAGRLPEHLDYSKCPYGKPGDRLWVREAYYQRGHWEPVLEVRTKTGRQKWAFVPADDVVVFDPPAGGFRKGMHKDTPDYVIWHQRLGRFMPRQYARITLEITGIRCERLQDISEADAIAEGIEAVGNPDDFGGWKSYDKEGGSSTEPIWSYRTLWESINGHGSWVLNPWVWVVEFKPLPQNADNGR